MSWCDYDNDHDLDLLITGRGSSDQRVTVLYRNDEGIFNDSGESFIAVDESMVAWGDYDQDGDQDLLIAGNADQGFEPGQAFAHGRRQERAGERRVRHPRVAWRRSCAG